MPRKRPCRICLQAATGRPSAPSSSGGLGSRDTGRLAFSKPGPFHLGKVQQQGRDHLPNFAGEVHLHRDDHEPDPALEIDSVTDLWPGAEWPEREVFDMFGIRFRNHPDLRRILTWEEFPAHPLRKDYPLRGRGERETYKVVDREST